MKMLIFVVMVVFTSIVGADEPKSTSAVKARRTYEKALQVAEDERNAALQSAKADSLKDLQAALDSALKKKNLKEANTVAAAMKSIKDDSVFGDTPLPAVEKLKQTYEECKKAANDKYQKQGSLARAAYLTDLESALDVAFEGKDLEEANRIDAVMQPLRAEAAAEEAAAAKTDAAAKAAAGPPGKATFMNIDSVGKMFVYVIDKSSSMTGGRLKIAQGQLKASLRPLQPNQKFAVIFFNEYRERLKLRRGDNQPVYSATDVNKELASHQIDRVTADRGTVPMPAILEAISLKPDVIYFLTDGDESELSPAEMAQVRQLSRGITIHVIKLGDGTLSSPSSNWLKRLADQSHGEYREINIAR